MAIEKRKLSARLALEWAFGAEKAVLELPDLRDIEDRGYGFGTEHILAQRMRLGGVRIEGGGRSFPHDDADLIAGLVASLPQRLGGVTMAIYIANLSRMATKPDWMPDAAPRIRPAGWKGANQNGRLAKTELVRVYSEDYTTPHPKNRSIPMVRTRKFAGHWCPCVWDPHPEEIKSARRNYHRWWEALDYIRQRMMSEDLIETIEITPSMPRRRPWLDP